MSYNHDKQHTYGTEIDAKAEKKAVSSLAMRKLEICPVGNHRT